MKPDRRSTLQCDTIIGDSELVAAKVSDSEIALVLCPSRSLDLKAGAAEIVLRQEIFLTSIAEASIISGLARNSHHTPGGKKAPSAKFMSMHLINRYYQTFLVGWMNFVYSI
jgi:hypothetical protein